ncbi:proline-serine-threonine phosphatase-interacting protein 1-like [Ruditapes philippinarum]|uniref:proline-serine-threonine phosphatase-interacting protein 1-like n=1 Tax=Ruditapes philippinarum TaxID=129788 RepID=UPI00295B66F7|nr:proline-serine-threonine phosphatase-interacting protein 1-like [Ruditapes philippinarum]
MGPRFADSFWETDFNGTLGFDLLCKRIREGQKVCKDIEDFLKKRAKADIQYSKLLRSIARSADGKEEIGDLGLSWQELKNETEKTANFHESSAAELNKLADEISRFTDTTRSESKQVEDRVKEKQKLKKNAHNRLQELQKSYHEKCRDMIQQENQLDTARSSVTVPIKELEKLKAKVDKSREAMDKSDGLYKQSVEYLEQARINWETDMEEGCQLFQQLEEDRIYKLRDILWKCTNIDSQVCVDCDESCEIVRQCLEKCDIQKEMLDYIQTNMTGTVRPVRIEYENYFDNSRDKSPILRRRPPQLLPPLKSPKRLSPKNSNDYNVYSSIS